MYSKLPKENEINKINQISDCKVVEKEKTDIERQKSELEKTLANHCETHSLYLPKPDTECKGLRTQLKNINTLLSHCSKQQKNLYSPPQKPWNDTPYKNNWNGGNLVEYIKFADGRRRKVNIINRKKYVRVKGEMVPVAEAKKIISQSRKV